MDTTSTERHHTVAGAKFQALLTVADVARMLSISEDSVRDHASGRYRPPLKKALKLGGQWRFRSEDIEAFLEEVEKNGNGES